MTGRPPDTILEQASIAEPFGFLLKPSNKTDILVAVESALNSFRVGRKRTKDALQQAERHYKSLFDYAVEGIFRTTWSGTLIEANTSLAKTLGYDSSEELVSVVRQLDQQLYVVPERRKEAPFAPKNCD